MVRGKGKKGSQEWAIFETTHVLIGAEGWKEVVTEENIENLLRHVHLRVVTGKNEQTQKLK